MHKQCVLTMCPLDSNRFHSNFKQCEQYSVGTILRRQSKKKISTHPTAHFYYAIACYVNIPMLLGTRHDVTSMYVMT